MGWIRYLGFALPLSVALDFRRDSQYDAHAAPAVCSLCLRYKDETYAYGVIDRICRDDLVDTVRVSTWRVRPMPRTVVDRPEERIAEKVHELVPLDDLWERSFP